MNHDDGISNKSNNRPFADVLNVHISRRKVLAGGLAMAASTLRREIWTLSTSAKGRLFDLLLMPSS